MKIAIIGPAHPYRGGIATYNERLARHFQGQGHQVELYTFSLQYPDFLFPGKTQYSTEEKPKDISIHRLLNSINPLNWWLSGRKIAKKNFDLIIVRYWLPLMAPCLGSVLRVLKSNSNAKIIALVDNIIPHEKRIGDHAFTQYFVGAVDGFLAMSQNVIDDIQIFDKHKPRTLSPHPLFDNYGDILPQKAAQKALGLDPAFKYVLFFGLIRKYKGLDLLLQALGAPILDESPIKLIIAGEYYDDKAYYATFIEKHQLSDRIISIEKFIPDEEVALYFNACDLVVQPYRSATQSGVTQVAYHFNKPMVVTNVGGLEEMCPDGIVGFVVDQAPASIAQAIHQFFYATDIPKMIDNVRIEKQKFSWDVLGNSLLQLYKGFRN